MGSVIDLAPVSYSVPFPTTFTIHQTRELWRVIGIDHDTVCAGVLGTAIRHSTSCAGRRAAAPAGTTSAVPDCSTKHSSADRISGQFLFYHDLNTTFNVNFNEHLQTHRLEFIHARYRPRLPSAAERWRPWHGKLFLACVTIFSTGWNVQDGCTRERHWWVF